MKKFFKVFFVASIAVVAGYNVYQSQSVMNGMPKFALANVEALASVNPLCPNGCLKDGDGCYCNGWFETYKEAGPVI